MTFAVQFYNLPSLTLITTGKRLFRYDLLDFSINGIRSQLRDGITDLGTIPDLAEDIVQNDDPHWIRSFILHDENCRTQGNLGPLFPHYSSFEAACILKAGGLADGSSEDKAFVILAAVALEGPHWK